MVSRKWGNVENEENTGQLIADISPQALSDRLLGGLMLLVSTFVFSYYTTWALLTVS